MHNCVYINASKGILEILLFSVHISTQCINVLYHQKERSLKELESISGTTCIILTVVQYGKQKFCKLKDSKEKWY